MVPCERLLEAAGKDDNAAAEGRSNGIAFAMSGAWWACKQRSIRQRHVLDIDVNLVFVFLAS
jgi:hypothetical protein